MKLLFCDIQRCVGEKSVEIAFEVCVDPDSHDWVHYCHVHKRLVGLRLDGKPDVAFCPMCGASVVRDGFSAPAPLNRSVVRAAFADAPLCAHGWPDVPCGVLVERDAALEQDFGVSVPEYTVARIVSQFQSGGVTAHWARPCARCRAEYARHHVREIEVELEAARKFLEPRVRAAQREVRGLAMRLSGLAAVMRLLARHGEAAPAGDVPEHPGFVYAIGNSEVVKIGWTSKHPRAENGRLAQLQTASHVPLNLLGLIAGTQADEHALHVRFAAYRLRGEWFRAIPEIVEYFRDS
jgi:hypothetical protein